MKKNAKEEIHDSKKEEDRRPHLDLIYEELNLHSFNRCFQNLKGHYKIKNQNK